MKREISLKFFISIILRGEKESETSQHIKSLFGMSDFRMMEDGQRMVIFSHLVGRKFELK